MAFELPGGFIFDRPVDAVGRNAKGELLYNLRNVSELSIEFSADSKDATDADGALVKRLFTAKTGTVSLTNSFMSLPAYQTTTGTDAKIGSDAEQLECPKLQHVVKGTATIDIDNLVEGTLYVDGIGASGGKIEAYELSTDAGEKAFSYDKETKKLTLPTNPDDNVVEFLVFYTRKESAAFAIENLSDTFPKQHQLTIRVIGYAPCSPEVPRALYIVIDNFQPSADASLSFQTDSTQEFSGDILTSYCGTEKRMMTIYYVDEEEDK